MKSTENENENSWQITSTLFHEMKAIFCGLYDSVRLIQMISLIWQSRRVKSLLRDGFPLWIVYLAVNTLCYIYATNWTQRMLVWIFWIAPVYLLSNVQQYKSFNKFANEIGKKSRRRHNWSSEEGIESVLEIMYGTLVIQIYMGQIEFVKYVLPFSWAKILYSIVNYALLISFQVMEYRSVHAENSQMTRMTYFENRWGYFLGFGLPISCAYSTLPFQLVLGIYPMVISFMMIQSLKMAPMKSTYRIPLFYIPSHLTKMAMNTIIEIVAKVVGVG